MAWIDVIPFEDADDELKPRLEKMQYAPGKVASILHIQSLLPETMDGHHNLYKSVMYGQSDLSRKERELIAVVVSIANECHY